MEYQIIRATPELGQIEVMYKHDGRSLAVYAIDVPVVDGAFLTGDALHEEIMHRAPTWLIQREQEVASATGFDEIVAVAQPYPVNPTDNSVTHAAGHAELAFEKAVAKALVKFGVLQSDPTEIEVTKL